MKISDLILTLNDKLNKLGDVEVLITDGFDARCYRGNYEIIEWQDDDGRMCVDIGIGGCLEE